MTPAAPETVELRVPAEAVFVPMLRSLSMSLGARCDLTVDEIEDLGIAVDEACALLLPSAVAHGTVDAHFTLGAGALTVRVVVASGPQAEPDRDGFAWTVLRAVADDVAVERADGTLGIALHKRRAGG